MKYRQAPQVFHGGAIAYFIFHKVLCQTLPKGDVVESLYENNLGGEIMAKPYFKIFKDNAGEWRWTLYAANHEPVAVSEGYTRRESAETMAVKLWQIAYDAVK